MQLSRLILVVLIGSYALLAPRAAEAQSYCLPASDESEALIQYLKRLMTTTESRETNARDNIFKVPVVTPTSIVLSSDERTCSKAAAAYGPAPGSSVNPPVYVVKLGNEGYAVLDPLQVGDGGVQTVMVFDRRWVAIGGWTGP